MLELISDVTARCSSFRKPSRESFPFEKGNRNTCRVRDSGVIITLKTTLVSGVGDTMGVEDEHKYPASSRLEMAACSRLESIVYTQR